jgi:hypothetical protein
MIEPEKPIEQWGDAEKKEIYRYIVIVLVVVLIYLAL